MSRYPVTTMGELAVAACELATSSPSSSSACACNAPATSSPATMRGFDDLAVLYNPIVWAAQKLIGAGIARVTGKEDDADAAHPGVLDHLARALGVDPVEVAIELTGYSGVGRYWPAMRIAGGAAAIGGAAYLAARALKARRPKTKRKGKR
jgi:hypothetical protein